MDSPNLMDSPIADDYFITALQIFECCGAAGSAALPVNTLMEKFAPFIRTDKYEYKYLQSLMDPHGCNPKINVKKLADTLEMYSLRPKGKHDFEESFNLKTGQTPQDSDSGISTDGYQLLEDLQTELKEKSHVARQLRAQLELLDKQHQEDVASLTAERDTLRTHLQLMREENATLAYVKKAYEECTDRLASSDAELCDARNELEAVKKKQRLLQDAVEKLENERLTLQELIKKSKEENHRINDMYASRQAALIEENESLKTDYADVSTKFHDQEDYMQQVIKEKVLLEMELKDVLNKSAHLDPGRMDQSIDVSYNEAQIIHAFDTITTDTQLTHANLSQEEFFIDSKDDYGRTTNISLFDELRQSMDFTTRYTNDCERCKMRESKICMETCSQTTDNSKNNNECMDSCKDCNESNIVIDENICNDCKNKDNQITNFINDIKKFELTICDLKTDLINLKNTDQKYTKYEIRDKQLRDLKIDVNLKDITVNEFKNEINENQNEERECFECKNKNKLIEILNNDCSKSKELIRELQTDLEIKCNDCKMKTVEIKQLTTIVNKTKVTINDLQIDISESDHRLQELEGYVAETVEKNNFFQKCVCHLQMKIDALELTCKKVIIRKPETTCMETQTELGVRTEICSRYCQTVFDQTSVGTQVAEACVQCLSRQKDPPRPTGLKRFVTDAFRSMFQLFAIGCFMMALLFLYNVSHYNYSTRRCVRANTVPWQWMGVNDFLNFVFRIEYVGEVPM